MKANLIVPSAWCAIVSETSSETAAVHKPASTWDVFVRPKLFFLEAKGSEKLPFGSMPGKMWQWHL